MVQGVFSTKTSIKTQIYTQHTDYQPYKQLQFVCMAGVLWFKIAEFVCIIGGFWGFCLYIISQQHYFL